MKKIKFNPKIFTGLKIFLITFTLLIMLVMIFSLTNLNKDGGNGLLGYKFFIVLSDSMKPEFQAGDIVFVKIVNKNNLQVGDIITFYSNYNIVVTHQIVERIENETGVSYITKGTNVAQRDENLVLAEKVIGQYTSSIPKAGYVINFIKSDLGFLIFIFIPLVILAVLNGASFVKIYHKFKKQQKEALLKQQEELEAERIKNEQMNEELKLLKEKLNSLGNNS